MRKVWTVQSEYAIDKLIETGYYYPNFNTGLQFAKNRKNSYGYILDYFNRMNNSEFNGLVFTVSSFDSGSITTYDDYKKMIYLSGAGGISNYKDNYYVLELEVSDDIELCECQFYNFCDLIAYLDDTEDYDITEDDIEHVKNSLFNKDACIDLHQAHLGYIDKSMIKGVYKSYHGALKSHIISEPIFTIYGPPSLDEYYGKCEKLCYYMNKLNIGDGKYDRV